MKLPLYQQHFKPKTNTAITNDFYEERLSAFGPSFYFVMGILFTLISIIIILNVFLMFG